jgi:hypothetical protein
MNGNRWDGGRVTISALVRESQLGKSATGLYVGEDAVRNWYRLGLPPGVAYPRLDDGRPVLVRSGWG